MTGRSAGGSNDKIVGSSGRLIDSSDGSSGLLKVADEHIVCLKNKLQKVQNQLKSSNFDRLEAYGSLSSAMNDANKLQQDVACRIQSIMNSQRIQLVADRECNKQLDDKISKLRLMAIRGNNPQTFVADTFAHRNTGDSLIADKLKAVLGALDLDNPESYGAKNAAALERQVRERIVNLRQEIHQNEDRLDKQQGSVPGLNHDQVEIIIQENERLKSIVKDSPQPVDGYNGDVAAKRKQTELEFENKKLKEWIKNLEADHRSKLEEDAIKNEETLHILENRIAQVEEEYQQKLREWKKKAESNEQKLNEHLKASESNTVWESRLRDTEARHRVGVTEFETSINQLNRQIAKLEKDLEKTRIGSRTQLSELESQMEKIHREELESRIRDLDSHHSLSLQDIQRKFSKSETSRGELAEKVQHLESVAHRSEVTHREVLSQLREQMMRDVNSHRNAAEQALKDKERDLIMPYKAAISKLEDSLRVSENEKERVTKDFSQRLLDAQNQINSLTEANNDLSSKFTSEGSNLKESLSQSTSTIKKLESDLRDIRQKLATQDGMMADMNRKHQESVDGLEEQLITAKKEKDRIEEIYAEKFNDLSENDIKKTLSLESDLKFSQSLLKSKEQEYCESMSNRDKRIKELQEELKVAEKKVAEATGKKSEDVQRVHESHQQTINDLQESIDSLTSNTLSLNNIIDSLQSQLKDAKAESSLMSDANESLKVSLKKSEDIISKLHEGHDEIKQAMEIETESIRMAAEAKAQSARYEAKEEINNLRKQAQQMHEKLEETFNALEDKEEQYNRLEKDLLTAQDELKIALESRQNMKTSLQQSLAKVKEVTAELAVAKQPKEDYADEESERGAQRIRDEAQNELESERLQINEEREKLTKMVQSTEGKEAGAAAVMQKALKLQCEIEAEKLELEKLKAQLKLTEETNKQLEVKLARERSELDTKSKDLKVAHESLIHKTDDVELQLGKIKESEKIIGDIEERVWKEQAFLEEKNDIINQLEADKQTLVDRVEFLEREIANFNRDNDSGVRVKVGHFEHTSPIIYKSANQPSIDNLRPSGSLLGNMSGPRMEMFASFDLDDQDKLDKSFEVRESLVIPKKVTTEASLPLSPHAGENEFTKLHEKISRMEKSQDELYRDLEEQRNKTYDAEMKLSTLQSEIGKVCSEKQAVENLLHQIGMEKKTQVAKLIKEIEAVERRQKEEVEQLVHEYERRKTEDIGRIEKTLEEKYQKMYTLPNPPARDTKQKNSDDEWLESEEESSEQVSPALKKPSKIIEPTIKIHDQVRLEDNKSTLYSRSHTEPENISTARSVPANISPSNLIKDTPVSSARQLEDIGPYKRKQPVENTRKVKSPAEDDFQYVMKKPTIDKKPSDIESPVGRDSYVEKSPENSNKSRSGRKDKFRASETGGYVLKDSYVPEYVAKPASKMVTSSIQEKEVENNDNLNQDVIDTETIKQENKSKVEEKQLIEKMEESKWPVLLSDLINEDDFNMEEQEPEWYHFDQKGKSAPLKDQDNFDLAKLDGKSSLASSHVQGESAVSRKESMHEKESVSQSGKKKETQNSGLWSAILVDDDFSQYYKDEEEQADESVRGSVVTNPMDIENDHEDKANSEKKKKKKKKKTKGGLQPGEMDLRMICGNR